MTLAVDAIALNHLFLNQVAKTGRSEENPVRENTEISAIRATTFAGKNLMGRSPYLHTNTGLRALKNAVKANPNDPATQLPSHCPQPECDVLTNP
ncbi:hypothetical protein [Halomicronema sp. CCY15110]|uniref:hypothetical protein n=1 Tax=Halomicronema sp. CCY15110 TaxID=2767773 RepID=UPI001950FA9D|nr:hypothetical protein [Halomicronema sp. CCY15110]